MNEALKTTVNKTSFDKVFVEVPCVGSLCVRAQEQLRLFRIRDVFDNNFDIEALRNYVAKNIGYYVFSRSKLKQYYDEDDVVSVGMDALEKMQQAGPADQRGTGNELGEILLYAFFETILDAPKIYSKVELNSTVRTGKSAADSIHLRLLGPDGDRISYELVFGSSSMVGDLEDAVEEAFLNVERVKNQTRDELRIVDAAVFDLPEDDPVALQINQFIKPTYGQEITRVPAYGLFLGYTLGLGKNRTDSEYRELIEQKMEDDIQHALPLIVENIKRLGLQNRSFYVYVFPLDDIERDKRSVMKRVLKEGELNE